MFDGFLDEDMVRLIGEIKSFAEQRKMECEKVIGDILQSKTNSYQTSFVNFYLEYNTQKEQNQQLPAQLKQKIDHLKKLGGAQTLKSMVSSLKESQMQCIQFIETLKQKIKTEEDEDNLYRQQYGDKWNRVPSAQNTKDYVKLIQDYEGKLKIAISVDAETENKLAIAE